VSDRHGNHGPTIRVLCHGCRWHEQKRYQVQGDSGYEHSCSHPQGPPGKWEPATTPETCPVRPRIVRAEVLDCRKKAALRRLAGFRVGQEVYLLCAKVEEGSHGASEPVIYPRSLCCIRGRVCGTLAGRESHVDIEFENGTNGEYDTDLVLMDPGPYRVEEP